MEKLRRARTERDAEHRHCQGRAQSEMKMKMKMKIQSTRPMLVSCADEIWQTNNAEHAVVCHEVLTESRVAPSHRKASAQLRPHRRLRRVLARRFLRPPLGRLRRAGDAAKQAKARRAQRGDEEAPRGDNSFQSATGVGAQLPGHCMQLQWEVGTSRWAKGTGRPPWCYDAFGLIGTTSRELDWKTLIFFEKAVPISPNAW